MLLFVFLATASLTHGRDTIWRESSATLKNTKYSLDIHHTPRDWWDAAYNGCGEGWLYSPKSRAEEFKLLQQLPFGAKYWLGGVQSLRWIWTVTKSPFNKYNGFLPTTDVNITSATTLEENSAQACQYSCDTNNTCKGDCQYMFGLKGKTCYCLDLDLDTQSKFNYRYDEKEMECPGSIDDRCGNSEGMSIYLDANHPPYPHYDHYFLTSVSPQDECAYFSCSVGTMTVSNIYGTSNCTQRKAYTCGGAYHDDRLTWFEATESCSLMNLTHGYLYHGGRGAHSLCPRQGYREVWIGLRMEKKWKWLDGSDIEMNSIKEDNTTGRGCLAITRISTSTGSAIELSHEPCSLQLAYVCQKEITGQDKSVKCNETALMAAVAEQKTVSDVRSTKCSNGLSVRPEALVLALCSAQVTMDWRPKEKVMDSCSTMPLHTAVATFQLGYYVETEHSLAGIFLGCTSNGFTMAVQMCGQPPRIVNLVSGQSGSVANADNYYVITYAPKDSLPIIG